MNTSAVHPLVAAEVTRLKLSRGTETLPGIKASSRRLLQFLGLAFGMAALPSPVFACAACFGKSDDALARGMNMGIFSLLIVITSVLIGLVAFFIFLARRSARFAAQAADADYSAPSAAEVPASISQTTP